MHSTDNELGKEYMGATGGMRKWLNGKNLAKREEWLEPEVMAYDHRIFARETGGYAAALNWCRAQLHNINAEDEKAIPEANYILDQPVLLIRTDNFISATADMATQMKATALKLEVKKMTIINLRRVETVKGGEDSSTFLLATNCIKQHQVTVID
ncbi:hypothetical protein JHW43_001740 [Diplocarpon mali]|nr:hypothetical protein JHW43_001740 [Diplocarpon mali]